MTISSADEFARLRRSEEPDDYRRAAQESASLEVWQEVVDRHPDLRRWVAHNKTVPLEILERLAADADSDVRWTVAMKRKASPAILRQLAADPEDAIRLRVANHRNTPESVLRLLTGDPWEEVREVSQRRLDELSG
jgi:hypothetical protein